MAKRKPRTPESVLDTACDLLAEHHAVAAVVYWSKKPDGEPVAIWRPIGDHAAAERLLEIASAYGMTIEELNELPGDDPEA